MFNLITPLSIEGRQGLIWNESNKLWNLKWMNKIFKIKTMIKNHQINLEIFEDDENKFLQWFDFEHNTE